MLTYPHEGAGWCKRSSGSAEHIRQDNGIRGYLIEKRAESLGKIFDGKAVGLYLYAGCSLLCGPLEFEVVVYEKIGEGVTNLLSVAPPLCYHFREHPTKGISNVDFATINRGCPSTTYLPMGTTDYKTRQRH